MHGWSCKVCVLAHRVRAYDLPGASHLGQVECQYRQSAVVFSALYNLIGTSHSFKCPFVWQLEWAEERNSPPGCPAPRPPSKIIDTASVGVQVDAIKG